MPPPSPALPERPEFALSKSSLVWPPLRVELLLTTEFVRVSDETEIPPPEPAFPPLPGLLAQPPFPPRPARFPLIVEPVITAPALSAAMPPPAPPNAPLPAVVTVVQLGFALPPVAPLPATLLLIVLSVTVRSRNEYTPPPSPPWPPFC